MRSKRDSAPGALLGIEGGGTRTVALLAAPDGKLLQRFETGPANLRLLNDRQLASLLKEIAREFPRPAAVGIGLAGLRTDSDHRRVLAAVQQVWKDVPFRAAHDLETALLAAEPSSETSPREAARVVVLSGTGSCCYGRAADGRTAKLGGWGHILGDKGSAFEIGLRALKACVYYFDRDGDWSGLGERILRTLQLNEPDELIPWVQTAGKREIAALALEVFAAWEGRDKIAHDILEGAAHSLAKDAAQCAGRLAAKSAPVRFILAGGVLTRQPRFARKVAALLRQLRPSSTAAPLKRESAWGAVELARQALAMAPGSAAAAANSNAPKDGLRSVFAELTRGLDANLAESPTERRNPRSMNLGKLPIRDAVDLMLNEEQFVTRGIRAAAQEIERVVRRIARAFREGGRLFYLGAGTSGRLGVLDASECPPTFRTQPEMVQGIIAGGQSALWKSVEGAEDDSEAGARAVEFRGVRRGDVVAGIAASGRTPFVWGALLKAKEVGAATLLVSFNPALRIPRKFRPDHVIAVDAGPEILTGSTRLKAGTATKLILNMLTTLSMVQVGKVTGNLMTDLNPSNEKLRGRAVRIVSQLAGVDEHAAKAALEKSGWQVKDAASLCRFRSGRPRKKN